MDKPNEVSAPDNETITLLKNGKYVLNNVAKNKKKYNTLAKQNSHRNKRFKPIIAANKENAQLGNKERFSTQISKNLKRKIQLDKSTKRVQRASKKLSIIQNNRSYKNEEMSNEKVLQQQLHYIPLTSDELHILFQKYKHDGHFRENLNLPPFSTFLRNKNEMNNFHTTKINNHIKNIPLNTNTNENINSINNHYSVANIDKNFQVNQLPKDETFSSRNMNSKIENTTEKVVFPNYNTEHNNGANVLPNNAMQFINKQDLNNFNYITKNNNREYDNYYYNATTATNNVNVPTMKYEDYKYIHRDKNLYSNPNVNNTWKQHTESNANVFELTERNTIPIANENNNIINTCNQTVQSWDSVQNMCKTQVCKDYNNSTGEATNTSQLETQANKRYDANFFSENAYSLYNGPLVPNNNSHIATNVHDVFEQGNCFNSNTSTEVESLILHPHSNAYNIYDSTNIYKNLNSAVNKELSFNEIYMQGVSNASVCDKNNLSQI